MGAMANPRTDILLNDAGSVLICTVPGEEFPVLCRVESGPEGSIRYAAVARFINDDEADFFQGWLQALKGEAP